MKARHMQTRKKKKKQEESVSCRGIACCFEWVEAIIGILLLVTVFFTFLCGWKRVDQDVMKPSLYPEDRVLVTHLFYQPQVQDIVMISGTEGDERKIQRVVALEGQTVEIAQNGQVYVDGIIIPQFDPEGLKEEKTVINQSFQIPEGYVLVMGDHEKPVQQEMCIRDSLWTAFLKEGFEPVEFEWLADEISKNSISDRMEWELSLRETMDQLHFHVVNQENSFALFDGLGKRLYFGADCRQSAERALIKILFPLNYQ